MPRYSYYFVNRSVREYIEFHTEQTPLIAIIDALTGKYGWRVTDQIYIYAIQSTAEKARMNIEGYKHIGNLSEHG
jgi:hypothetical protein